MKHGLRRIAAGAVLAAAVSVAACGGADDGMVEIQRVKAGDLDIVLLSADGALDQGNETFVIEFRKPDGTLQDAGTVRTSATMTMPGMTMPGNVQVVPADVPGRYRATGNFGMSGGWQMKLDWNGPAGQGAVTVDGMVQ